MLSLNNIAELASTSADNMALRDVAGSSGKTTAGMLLALAGLPRYRMWQNVLLKHYGVKINGIYSS